MERGFENLWFVVSAPLFPFLMQYIQTISQDAAKDLATFVGLWKRTK